MNVARRSVQRATIVRTHGSAALQQAVEAENLCRAELTDAEEAAAVIRRKKVYERMHPETSHGGDRKSKTKSSRQFGDLKGAEADRFTADTVAKTGKSERTIQRAAKRGEDIGADNLTKLAGTFS
jgi:ParB family transcriptional regulator, chromosome partitioning protein